MGAFWSKHRALARKRDDSRGVYLCFSLFTEVEWDFGDLSFSSFRNAIRPQDVVGENLVLHITQEDVYLSVKFLSWEGNENGGAFS